MGRLNGGASGWDKRMYHNMCWPASVDCRYLGILFLIAKLLIDAIIDWMLSAKSLKCRKGGGEKARQPSSRLEICRT